MRMILNSYFNVKGKMISFQFPKKQKAAFGTDLDGDDLTSVLTSSEAMIRRLLKRDHVTGRRVEDIGVGVPGYLNETAAAR
ncbi:hypothetical protein JXO59_03270 [candidate division KSB1 bacterium]|nr:hypothetical protein [candidate division KSB1 bacterium]